MGWCAAGSGRRLLVLAESSLTSRSVACCGLARGASGAGGVLSRSEGEHGAFGGPRLFFPAIVCASHDAAVPTGAGPFTMPPIFPESGGFAVAQDADLVP